MWLRNRDLLVIYVAKLILISFFIHQLYYLGLIVKGCSEHPSQTLKIQKIPNRWDIDISIHDLWRALIHNWLTGGGTGGGRKKREIVNPSVICQSSHLLPSLQMLIISQLREIMDPWTCLTNILVFFSKSLQQKHQIENQHFKRRFRCLMRGNISCLV